MLVDIIMPKMGESITEGTIIEWRKKVGDTVDKDEIFLEIGTDKVDSEIPSPAAGVLVEILAKPNDVIDVGKVIGRINTDVSSKSDAIITDVTSSEKENIQEIKTPKVDIKKDPIVPKKKLDKPKRSFFTPVVMKIANENNITMNELESIKGSGRSGRVTKKDILFFLKNYGRPSEELKEIKMSDKVVEMEYMRKRIADHMRTSLDTAAHVYVMTEVDMTDIVNYVVENENSFFNKESFKLTYTPFIVNAVVKAINQFPLMNSSIEGNEIIHKKNINIGLAVSLDGGLMVPVIENCEEVNFLGLCRRVNDLSIRARSNKLQPDELQGSTFSISNFGVFNITMGTPIINQPNVGILGVGAIKKQPVVIESDLGDAIGIRSQMILSLGFDHRLIDGAEGSKFIEKIRFEIENMDLMDLF
ncbi:MAG: dihydrolipoamide acetyltransferase family protein [Candidatus Neomarinimicrobiota bacterium]|nr:dihydrolipoamide acetyltransferase family protein [Candidatus Neomarinimicrobiota bacterium]